MLKISRICDATGILYRTSYTFKPISNICELRHYCQAQICVQAGVMPNLASQTADLPVYGFTGAESACSACVAPVEATGVTVTAGR